MAPKSDSAAAEPAPLEPAPAGVYLVSGPEDGRFRGGLLFGPTVQEVDFAAIGAARAQAILDDPRLSVRLKPAK